MLKTWILPLLATLLLHGLIVAIVAVSWADDSLEIIAKPMPRFVKAELVVLEKPKAKPVPVKTPKPVEDQTAKQEQLRQQKLQQEKQRQQKLQQEKQRQEALKQEKLKQEKLQQERAKQEAQKQQQLAAERERQRLLKESEQEMAELLAQESAEQQSASDEELATSYIALISQAIQSQWSRPPSARNNMEAELALQLTPSGEIVGVRVVKSSGNSAFDRSAESAVLKVGRIPELQQMPNRVFEKYFRRLTIRFRPEDLRL